MSWRLSKQACIAASVMKSICIALDKATKEAKWLQNFMDDILLWPKSLIVICIHGSNMAIQARVNNMYNRKSRHIS